MSPTRPSEAATTTRRHCVTHADGDLNTELTYLSHETQQLADNNVTRTVIHTSDTVQALDVDLVYTAYARENVITTHAEIRNREKGTVVLHSFYLGTAPAGREIPAHTPPRRLDTRRRSTTRCSRTARKSISSIRGVRTTHAENPSFMLTLGSDRFDEASGEVVAGTLAWSGNFRLNSRWTSARCSTSWRASTPGLGVPPAPRRDVHHPGDDLHPLVRRGPEAPAATSTTGAATTASGTDTRRRPRCSTAGRVPPSASMPKSSPT